MISTMPPTVTVVTVQAGNTMSQLASAHGISLNQIEADNPQVHDPNVLYVGERLRVTDEPPAGTYREVCTLTVDARGNGSLNDCSITPTASPSSLPVKPTSSVPVTPTPPGPSAGNSQPTSGQGGDDLDNVPGVPEKFAACVAYRESTDLQNPAAHNNAYGIIAASGYNVAGDSIEAQKQVFATLWKDDGQWRPWLADGCPQHFGYSNDWSADESSNSGPWGAS